MKSVLIIDDDQDYRDILTAWLEELDCFVQSAESTEVAFEILKRDEVDLIVCDLHLPFTLGPNFLNYAYSYRVGTSTIKELLSIFPETPILVISATMSWDLPGVLRGLPKLPVLTKPFTREEFLMNVNFLTHGDLSAASAENQLAFLKPQGLDQ